MMFKISSIYFFLLLGMFSAYSQNSDFSTSVNSQCPGNLFTLTADDNSMVSYNWTITEQGGASTNYNVNPVAFVLDNPGLYNVELTVSNGAGTNTTTENSFLEVFDEPTIVYTVTSDPYCAPAIVDFTSNSTAGSGTIISYQAFTDGTVYNTADFQHTYSSVGTYPINVSIENSNNCLTSLDLDDIVVTNFPALTSPLNPNTICSGTNFNYSPTSTIPGSTFSWVRLPNPDIIEVVSNGSGNISEVLTSSTLSNVAVSYEVTTTSPAGCSNVETVILTVQSLPVLTVDDAVLCTGQTTSLTATPSQGGGTYSWAPSGSSQTITVNAPGTYTVNYSIGSCASTPVSAEVTEVAPPTITDISYSETSGLLDDDGVMCAGSDNVTLTASASTGTGSFLWSQGGTSNSITVSPNSTTSYSVVYTDGECESAPFSAIVTVNNLPSNNYSSSITNACNSPVTTDYSSTSAGNIVWDFTGGTPATGAGQGPISVTYNSAGIYDITMTNTSGNGCVRVTNFPNTIVVGNGFPPTSSFSTTTPSPQCLEGNSFCFDYTGNGADTVEWDFGDGSPTQLIDQNSSVCHTYETLGTYNVTIVPYTTVGDVLGCSGISSQLTVEVLGPTSSFDVSPVDCDDQKTRTYTSTSLGVSGTSTYTWDFNDPPSVPLTGNTNPTYTFNDFSPTASSPFVVSLTVEDPATGCPPSVSSQNIYAFPNDLADYGTYATSAGAVFTDSVCLGSSLWFINQTPIPQSASNPNFTQWDWNTVNGYTWQTNVEFTGSPEEHVFSETASVNSGNQSYAPGNYEIAMRATRKNPPSGSNSVKCYDTVVHTIVVVGITGGFSIPDSICAGESFNAVDASVSPLSTIISREWDFDSDGIIDLSGNDPNPSHVFNVGAIGAGQEYVVTLTVTDNSGCDKTTTQTIWVRQPNASFDVNRDFICDDQTVTVTSFTNSTFSDATYSWAANTNVTPSTYVNTSNLDIIPPPFLFNDQGNHTITLTETDNLGCSDDTTLTISVFDVFAAATGTPNSASCFNPPSVVTFNNLSGNNVDPSSYQWYFGNGETSTETNPSTIYSLPGTFEVSLVVSSLTGGCSDSAVVETIDIGGPFGSISVTNPVLEGCSCYEANIDITTSDVAEATLLFGDGSFESLTINTTETITHQYCNTGTSSQNLTPILFISNGTCNGDITANETITIHPLPSVTNPGNFEYCEGENTTIIPFTSPVPGTSFSWVNSNTSTGLGTSGSDDIASFTAATSGLIDNISNVDVTPEVNATGCLGTTESFTITVKNTSTVDAGGPTGVICEGDIVSLNGSFGGDASTAQWSSAGTGVFTPNVDDLNATYTPSSNDIASGSVILTLTTNDPVGPCPSNSSDITITINTAVIVNAGPDASICSSDVFTTQGSIGGSATDNVWNSSGTGVFSLPTVPVTTYTPSPADLAAGSVVLTISTDDPGGPCDQSSSSMTLSFSNAATLEVVTPLEYCVGSDVSLTANIGGAATGVSWSSSGAGIFTPNNTDLTPTYLPSTAENVAGVAIVTATTADPDGSGPCLLLEEDVTINILDTVIVSAGDDAIICSNSGHILDGSIGGSASNATWTTSGSGIFSPNSSTLNAEYTPSAADLISGTIFLTLTTDDPVGPCFASSDIMELSFSTAATIDIPTTTAGTCDNSAVPVSATVGGSATSLTWSGGSGTYTPNVFSLNIDYSPSAAEITAGTLILTATTNDPDGTGPCEAAFDDVTINIATDVIVDAGIDQEACSDEGISLNGSIGGAASSAEWSGGLGSFFPNNSQLDAVYTPTAAEIANGSVTLTLTTDDPVGPCQEASAQVTYSFTFPASVSAGGDEIVCSNTSIALDGSIGGTASTATWSGNGSGTFNNVNSLGAVYSPSATDLTLGIVVLTLTTDNPVGACPSVSSSMNLTVNEAALLSVDSPLTECVENEFTLTATIGGGATGVTWSNGNGLFTPNVSSLTPTYLPTIAENNSSPIALQVATNDPDGSGPCLAIIEQVILQIDAAATVSAGSDDVVCSNDDIALNASIGGLASSATWSSDGTGTFNNINSLVAVYTPSNADMLSGSVTLTLTTDDPAGACPSVSSAMNLTVNEAATITVNTPIESCIDEQIALVSTVGGSATSVTWTNGSGIFTPNPNELSPDYLPSTSENTNGGLILDVNTNDPDGIGPCPVATAQVQIIINALPTVFAGNDADVCSNNQVFLNGTFGGSASTASWSATGGGTFDNITNLNATYSPDATDLANGSVTLTLTTDDPIGPCVAVSSSLLITFIDIPSANAGVNQDVCSDQIVNLAGLIGGSASQGTWSSAGSGSFTPNELTLNGQYVPSAADIASGSVLLTLTTDDPSGVCGTVSSDVTMNIFDFAVADAGSSQSICSAENADLGGTIGGSATSVTWTTVGDGVFTPNVNALNATYVPGTNDQNSGFVTLTMTTNDPAGPCPAVSSEVEISISGVAVVDPGANFTVCAGADAQLNGSITGAVITGFWSGGTGVFSNPADLNATYTPTPAELASGSVILTLTSEDPVGPCGPESAEVTVSFTSSAIVSAGLPQTICEGDDVALSGVVGGSAVTGSWSGGAGVFVPNANDLNAVYTPSAAEIFNGSAELILTTNNPAGPCEAASESILITINPSPILSSDVNVEACSGQSVNYSITSDVSSTFSWIAQNDNPDISGESLTTQNSSGISDVLVNNALINQNINYLVSATAIGSGCVNDNQLVTVVVSPVVTMTTPSNQTLCVGENTADVFFSSSFGGVTYEWANNNEEIGLSGSGFGDINTFPAENNTAIIQTGNITVTPLTNGCPGVTTVFEITVNPSSTVNDPGAISECDGAPTDDIIFTGSDLAINYNWSNTNPAIGLPLTGNGNILSFTATNTTNDPIQSTVTVIPELNGCDGASQTFTINIDPSPDMDIPLDQTICVSNNSTPVFFTSNVIGTSYAWSNDNTNVGLGGSGVSDIPAFTTVNNGNQMDTATISVIPTFNGCEGPIVEFDFIINPILETNPISDTVLCASEEFPGVNFEGNVPNATYVWTNNNTSIGLGPNGAGDIINFITENSGTLNQTATIIVTPELPGCVGVDAQFTITVKPVPTVSVLPLSQTVCHNTSTTAVDFSGNIVNADYNWSNTNISIGIGDPGFNDIPSFTGTNTSLVPETGTFTVTPSFNGCVGAPENFTITVNPRPTVFPIPSQVLCADFPSLPVLFDGDFGAAATYTWTNTNVLIGLPENGVGDIGSFVVENTTSEEQTATITVTPSVDGCVGLTEVFTILVKPIPTLVGPIPNQSLCINTESDEVVFTGNLPDVTNYEWTNDNVAIGLTDQGVGTIPAFTAQNSGNTVIQATITVTPELNGCFGTSQQFTITTVDPVPVVFDPEDQVVCAGLETDPVIFNGPVPGTVYNWTNTNSSIGLSGQDVGDIEAFIVENTSLVDQIATVTVIPDFNGCEGESQTFTITVKPTPEVIISPEDQTLCSGQLTAEIDFSEDLIGTTYEWTNDNVSINLVANGTGNVDEFIVENLGLNTQIATISVTPTFNGCIGEADTALITVNPISTVIIAPGVDEYCHGESTVEYEFDSNNPGTQYSWTNSNSSIGLVEVGVGNIAPFVVTNTSLENQLATITVQPELNGCEGTAQIVQIIVKPIPTVDQVPDQNICANDMTDGIIFDGNLPDSTNYGWTHANVSIGLVSNGNGDIPSFTATNISLDVQETDITVTPSLNGCFGTTMTTSITVNPISTVNTVNDTVCSGEVVPQVDFTGTNPIATYTWENFNTSIGLTNSGNDSIISFTAENLGTTIQTAMIVVTPDVNGCPGINDTLEIVVNPLPVIEPIADYVYCAEDFSDVVTFNGNMSGNIYSWSNSNAAIGLNGAAEGDIPSFQTTNSGTGDLIGTVTVIPTANQCDGAAETFLITVHPLPDVEAGMDTTLCFEQSITLTATGANNYQWDNGVVNGVQFFPNSTEMYYVVGTDLNLCQNTDSVTVTYTLDLPPVVNAGLDTAICIGQDIILAATGDAILYVWNNDVTDGVVFVPSETNDYVVIGTAANGCIESDTVEVVINPLPIVSAFASDDFICAGESTLLWGEGADIYVWDLSVIDSVEFTPVATETYTVVGFDVNGCTDTTEIEVIVNPLPDVLFSTDMTFGGCLPFEPTFTDLTSGPESNSVMWYFGNGATSTQLGSVLNTYDSYGCYDVTLVSTTTEGCTDSLTQQNFVCVNEVNAEFQPDVYEQSVVNPIFEFTNTSTNATSFEWFFGDGSESDFVNTTHFYDDYGNYVVSLVATAQDGCTDTAYAAITVIDEVLFYVPNSFTPNGDGKNEVFVPVLTAGYDRERGYEFRIYNRWGEQVFFSDTPGVGWDGSYIDQSGSVKIVQNGTYMWYVKFKDSMNNEIYDFSGHVNVIK